MRNCRNSGPISAAGLYSDFIDMMPTGSARNRVLTLNNEQTHVQRYVQPLLDRMRLDDFDPERLMTHRLPLEDAPQAYRMFGDKQDGCVRVVLKPWIN